MLEQDYHFVVVVKTKRQKDFSEETKTMLADIIGQYSGQPKNISFQPNGLVSLFTCRLTVSDWPGDFLDKLFVKLAASLNNGSYAIAGIYKSLSMFPAVQHAHIHQTSDPALIEETIGHLQNIIAAQANTGVDQLQKSFFDYTQEVPNYNKHVLGYKTSHESLDLMKLATSDSTSTNSIEHYHVQKTMFGLPQYSYKLYLFTDMFSANIMPMIKELYGIDNATIDISINVAGMKVFAIEFRQKYGQFIDMGRVVETVESISGGKPVALVRNDGEFMPSFDFCFSDIIPETACRSFINYFYAELIDMANTTRIMANSEANNLF